MPVIDSYDYSLRDVVIPMRDGVKLIDVYPDEVPSQPETGGYQLAVGMDILRGRYREGFVTSKPIKANLPLAYEFDPPPIS